MSHSITTVFSYISCNIVYMTRPMPQTVETPGKCYISFHVTFSSSLYSLWHWLSHIDNGHCPLSEVCVIYTPYSSWLCSNLQVIDYHYSDSFLSFFGAHALAWMKKTLWAHHLSHLSTLPHNNGISNHICSSFLENTVPQHFTSDNLNLSV